MSIAAVAHRRVFGLKEDVSNTITFLDDQTIFYPAGSNCIIYNHETRSQKFIPVTEKCDGITVLAVSGSKRFGVVAERSTTATAVIYDLHSLRRRKTLIPTDAASKEFVCMAFSSDAKYLLTQSGAPDWALYYWMWEKNKLMASVRTVNSERSAVPLIPSIRLNSGSHREAVSTFGEVVYQVSFSPTDNTYVCCIGNGILKFYRYQEGTLKIINATPKFEAKNFLCHAWVFEERVAVGTEDGKILIIEPSGELKAEIDYTVGLSQLPKPVYSMVPLKKGFVCGGGGGTAAVYERNELATGEAPTTPEQPRAFLRKVKDITTADESVRIITMAVSPNEELLVCSLDNRQLFSASLNSKVEEPKFEQYMQSFHHGQITGLDTCIRKPLIVTCATDRSIRVWNYQENTCELVKYFQEETYSVAIHPSGLYILVGFSDKLKLMNLLIDDIRPFREFSIRGCKECRFSTGGQYFAAVYGNTIQIFSTWNFENLANLKGHNGKVRSIYWTNDDSKIVTAGMDGAIYDWLLKDLTGSSGTGVKREGESILKSCSYTCAISSPDGKTIFAVGSDRTLKEITDSQIVKEVESDCVYTQIVLSHSGRMMFAGTSNGTIRSIKFPLASDTGEYQEHQGHSAAVTKLRVSFDDQFLFSTSEDGCLYVYKVSDKEGRGIKRDKEITYSDEILVTKSDLEEKNSMMLELKTRVEELKMENEYQLRLKDMNFNEKIKEVTEKFMQEIEALKITSTVLRTDKEKEEVRHDEEMGEERERHNKELTELEALYNAKLMSEYEKYQDLQVKTADLQEYWEKQMRGMQTIKENALVELTAQFEAKLREKQTEIDQLQEEMRYQSREFQETTQGTEEDVDAEIMELRHRYEKKLKEEREVGLRLKGENGIMRKKFNTLQSEIDAHKSEIAKMAAEEKKLHGVIKGLEKDIAGLKKEIQERDETIQDKEKRIYDLKKKNQELEKFKFVLDYKIKELKRQIEPREQDIQGMTHQIKEMDVELEHYNRANLRLETTISELKSKLRMAELNVDKEKAKVQQGMAVIKRFKRDVNNCVQYIQEPAQLMAHVKELFGKYSREWVKDDVEMELDIQEEYARQKQHLRRTVRTLRKQVMEDQGSHKADNLDVMNENVLLIKEINQLRKEMRISKQKEKAAEITLRHFIPATVDLGDAGPAPAAAAPEPLPEAENGPPERLHLPPLRQTVD